MDIDSTLMMWQLGMTLLIFFIGFRDVNLRHLAFLLTFGYVAYAPLGWALGSYLTADYGAFSFIYYAMANYFNYKLICMRGCYSQILAKYFHRVVGSNLGHLILPVNYRVRRYEQEFKLASLYKWWAFFNMLVLLQYPVSWWLIEPDGKVAVFFEEIYVAVLGLNKYIIWEAHTPAYRLVALVDMYILISLTIQSTFGLFVKNRLNA
jgi:hypothetical protein